MPTSQYSQVLDIAKKRGVVRPREIESRGLHREQLARLARRGDLEHVGRGLYRESGYAVTEKHDLVLACARVPRGVVCLFSALVFHELGTQRALSTWLAIAPHARRPKVDYPPIEVVHMSDASLSAGVETHRFEGITVRVFSVAKTVADCFKFRNRIGVDVAIEALRDYVRNRGSITELSRLAKLNRVERVMAPYVEALVS